MAGVSRDAVQDTVTHYRGLHVDNDVETRKEQYTTLVNHYYDLVTDFYEFGWGQHFHFAPRLEKEKFLASLERHERFLSGKLGLTPGMQVLDVGCGVGGPACYIAQSTGAAITGLNNNAYQIKRGERHTRRAKLTNLVEYVKADFMDLPFREEHFDAIYTIEASCHAPDRNKLFAGLRRVLKPGALFAGYEWCLTDAYDPDNAGHERIKKEIELGNGLPDLSHMSVIDEALTDAGFKLLETKDLAPTADVQTPWYLALTGEELSLSSLPRTPAGREIMNVATRVLERLRIAPKGTRRVSDFLNEGADALVAGGKIGIFTPMYFFMAQNPG